MDAELGAFQRTLKHRPGLKVVVERILANPMMMMGAGGLPSDQFFKAIEVHPNLASVVLFSAFKPDHEGTTLAGSRMDTTPVRPSGRPGEKSSGFKAIQPRADNDGWMR